MIMSILYTLGGKLYVNITNKCHCACVFCIRSGTETVGNSGSLWLEAEPDFDTVTAEFEKYDLDAYPEIVFCGFGEPCERLELLLNLCDWLRERTATPVRVNTNGLSDLINGGNTAPLFAGRADCLSVSLNAPTAEEYCAIVGSSFGEQAFHAMLDFASEAKKHVRTVFTVVDVITAGQIKRCEALAAEMEIPLRVRHYTANYDNQA